MDPIKANCRRNYHAVHNSGHRKLQDIWWIVLHDEEAPTAESAARYFEHEESGGSTQLCVDDTVCYRTLLDTTIPWGASSAAHLSANLHGFHIEQAGYARWLPKGWRLHGKTVERAAFKSALHLHKFKLPVVWVTADMLVAGVRHGHIPHGITTHREISNASKRLDPSHAWRYTHSDPGRFYPRRRFMRLTHGFYAEIAGV